MDDMKVFVLFVLSWMAVAGVQAQEMMGLAQIKQGVKSRRVSSYDRSGDNHDNIGVIKKGERRIIFDAKGAGIIDHIWITMGPEPSVLSRNDVIIRMYWDGASYPSVVSPIGPFFGQGWDESYLFTSAPLAATPSNGQGLVSYFAIPFAQGGRIEIENQAGVDIQPLYFYLDYVIDGDSLPTLNGTGTEDYFNTSWGAPKTPYSTPYFGYTRINNDMGFLGRTHIYRYNKSDPIYFDKSLKFTIEHGSNNVLTLDLASVAYWYLSEASPVPAIPDKEGRKPRPLINIGDIHRWRDAWRKSRGYDPKLWGN